MSRSLAITGPTKAAPVFCADFLSRDHLVPGGAKLVASAFLGEDAVVVVVGAAGAAANDTSVPVDALTGAIPSGTVLDFGAKKFARLTAAAAAAAVALTVSAIPTALVDDDTATYPGTFGTRKFVPAGTLIGRTFAERASAAGFGPWTTGDDEVYLTAFDIYDVADINDVELIRNGKTTVIKENFLPNYATLTAGQLAALRAAYITTVGAE